VTIGVSKSRPGLTVDALADRMARLFDDQSKTFRDKVLDAARDVQDDVLSRNFQWPWLLGSGVITTQADLAEYAVEPTIAQFVGGVMTIANRTPVVQIPLGELRRLQAAGTSSGAPSRFARVSDSGVVLWRTPGAVYSAAYDYRRSPTEIDWGGEPDMPVQHRWVWARGVEARMRMMDDRSDTLTKLAMQEYETAIARMMMDYASATSARRTVQGVDP